VGARKSDRGRGKPISYWGPNESKVHIEHAGGVDLKVQKVTHEDQKKKAIRGGGDAKEIRVSLRADIPFLSRGGTILVLKSTKWKKKRRSTKSNAQHTKRIFQSLGRTRPKRE